MLAQLKGLENLDLHQTAITDSGLKILENHPTLEELDLMDTQISDAGLASLARMPKLRYLDLEGTRITPEGGRRFAKARPEVDLSVDF